MILRNTGRVASSKDLDNAGVEDVMAVFEDMGFDSHPRGKTYWRDKVKRRASGRGGERQVDLIRRLAAGHRYSLEALCLRFSGQRTENVEKLTSREAWSLIEMLKATAAREARANRQQKLAFMEEPAHVS